MKICGRRIKPHKLCPFCRKYFRCLFAILARFAFAIVAVFGVNLTLFFALGLFPIPGLRGLLHQFYHMMWFIAKVDLRLADYVDGRETPFHQPMLPSYPPDLLASLFRGKHLRALIYCSIGLTLSTSLFFSVFVSLTQYPLLFMSYPIFYAYDSGFYRQNLAFCFGEAGVRTGEDGEEVDDDDGWNNITCDGFRADTELECVAVAAVSLVLFLVGLRLTVWLAKKQARWARRVWRPWDHETIATGGIVLPGRGGTWTPGDSTDDAGSGGEGSGGEGGDGGGGAWGSGKVAGVEV